MRAQMENAEIAALLYETADLMEIAGEDPFRIRSYRNGAAAIESHPERVADILSDPARDITEIRGIGKGLAAVLHELVERGSFERRDQMLAKYPPTALELLKIQGLGPKSIALLYQHYRCSTIDDLERLCREGKLRLLPRMGEKLEQKVLRSIEQYRRSASRFLLDFADRTAREIGAWLAATPGVSDVTPAGSLRRGRETVGDLDLLVTGPDPAPALQRFESYSRVREVLARGGNKCSARVGHEGLQVDVRVLDRASFGSALQYFTGSKDHNVSLRNRAIRMGFKLSEYGLFRISDETRVAGETEEEIYAALGLPWIPPELRENTGEIEAAEENHLPDLVELRQIRGDVHIHTSATDGRNTIAEMAAAAQAAGYQYLAITDHSQALAMANGLDERRIVEQVAEIRRVNQDFPDIRILAGCEVDIHQDGALDLADEALAQLDIVVGSVHSYMNLDSAQMTDRLLRAIENPYLGVLGHPTGRLLLRRDGYAYDFEQVVTAAVHRGVHFEINASPERLDLDPNRLRVARARGARFVISTDAHHTRHLDNMKYGVLTARRGWLGPSDILNTLEAEAFQAAVRRRG
jgi:DNA polymerase (family 10)